MITKPLIISEVEKLLQLKLFLAKENYEQANESVVNETKGSAGDKHETARAMAQIEVENAGKILKEAERNLEFFKSIPVAQFEKVSLGSLIKTNFETFYISLGLGKISFLQESIFCLNLNSPIGKILVGKQVGDPFTFNDKNYLIKEII
ncbi:MAG: 3-oxoacyl-ACP synthase [Bacteroidota bacterium]